MRAGTGPLAAAAEAVTLEFPGVGRCYLATFPAFRFELDFESPSLLTWTQIHDDGSRGRFETVAIRVEPIAGLIFLVAWQEANKTTVVAVQDFARRAVLSSITRSDGTFLQARGTLDECRPVDESPRECSTPAETRRQDIG